jgi:hypothetical protein
VNWEALGAIGETIGALGVIVTLAYLAIQIRHNSRVAALTAGHSISTGLIEFLERIALDPELHSLWNRALDSPESLDEAERDRFGRLMAGFFGRCLDAHRHGELDPQIAERYDHRARHYLGLAAVQTWWKRNREPMHLIYPELAAYVDQQIGIAKQSDTPAA